MTAARLQFPFFHQNWSQQDKKKWMQHQFPVNFVKIKLEMEKEMKRHRIQKYWLKRGT